MMLAKNTSQDERFNGVSEYSAIQFLAIKYLDWGSAFIIGADGEEGDQRCQRGIYCIN